MKISRVFLFVVSIGIFLSCSRTTIIGTELLDNEKTDLVFEEGLSLEVTTVIEDTVKTFPANLQRRAETFLCGRVEDPIFGTYESEIYTQIGLSFSSDPTQFIGRDIDSIVLFLQYDTAGLYGVTSSPVMMEVRQMEENLNVLDDYYANQSFPVNEDRLLAEELFIPRPYDSLDFFLPGDTTLRPPHVRMKMTQTFLNQIRQDTVNLLNQDSLNNIFNGMRIRLIDAEQTMLSFDMTGFSGVTVYYKDGTDNQRSYTFDFGFTTVKTAYIEHDYSGSVVEPFLDNGGSGDSLFFIQSMIGLNAEVLVDVPDTLKDIVVNYAELEFYSITLDEDNPLLYAPIDQLVTLEEDDSGQRIYPVDVAFPLSSNVLEQVFGGNVSEPISGHPDVRKYSMVVTSQMQEIIRGTLDKLLISSFAKANSASRTVFIGTNSQDFAPRLRLTYTKLPE